MLDRFSKGTSFEKAEQEQVEKQKIESKLIGTFNRTKGLKLFGYNILKDYLYEVDEVFEGDLYMIRDLQGKLRAVEVGYSKVFVNTNDEHFEKLNLENAQKWVLKFKIGRVKDLNNLKAKTKNTITL